MAFRVFQSRGYGNDAFGIVELGGPAQKNPSNPLADSRDFLIFFDSKIQPRTSQQAQATVIAMAAIPPAIMRIGFVDFKQNMIFFQTFKSKKRKNSNPRRTRTSK